MVFDLAIQDRLRDGRIVHLGVSVTTEADEIDDDVGAELVAVLQRHAADAHHRIGIFAIHVEDRNRQPLRQVGREASGVGIARIGGEADQIVDDDVDGAANGVAAQIGKVQRLGGDALPGECGVAVHQDRQNLASYRRVPGASAWRERGRARPDRPLPGGSGFETR